MIYWTGVFWVCTKHGTYFTQWCPICGANPRDDPHSKECCCKKCEPKEVK